jgi:hypothetical protein
MKGFQGVVTIVLIIQTLLIGALYLSIAEMQEDLSIYLDIFENKFNDVIWEVETFRLQSYE